MSDKPNLSYHYMCSSNVTTYNENGKKKTIKQKVEINDNGQKDHYYKKFTLENNEEKIIKEKGNKNLTVPDLKFTKKNNDLFSSFWNSLPLIPRFEPLTNDNDKQIQLENLQNVEDNNTEEINVENQTANQTVFDKQE